MAFHGGEPALDREQNKHNCEYCAQRDSIMHNNRPDQLSDLAVMAPARRENSEGGKRFVLQSPFRRRRPAHGDRRIVRRSDIGRAQSGPARRNRHGQDLYHGQDHRQTQRQAIILAPNKTLAAQLYGEFKGFFPDNAVEYFVSYYDYYQPEAYVARTDTYIEKESQINKAIDRMRHSATRALLERDDVIIVASVSCIYGIGSVRRIPR